MCAQRTESPPAHAPATEVLAALTDIVGTEHAVRPGADMAPYITERRDLFHAGSPLILRPANREQVQSILRVANRTNTKIIPQGGNTGLVGGQVPCFGNEIILSLSRLDWIDAADPVNNSIRVGAGAILSDIQAAANKVNRLFPLQLASEGSCQIGGNLSTNAGGTSVLAHGTAREQVLGLEVVLADGKVWNGLKTLRKDNTGYDLKQWFIGAEGSLGIITAASLKLLAKPKCQLCAFAAMASPKHALSLFHAAHGTLGPNLTSFELIPRIGLDLVLKHFPDNLDPLSRRYPYYVLLEFSSFFPEPPSRSHLEAFLHGAMGNLMIEDAVLASSLSQNASLWRLRSLLSEAQRREGPSIKHDISVPIGLMAAYLKAAEQIVSGMIPDARILAFGHIGDGNLHYNISKPHTMADDAFLAMRPQLNQSIHRLVLDFEGSISAEHGIGQLKNHLVTHAKGPVGLDMMGALKAALDPHGILNPGKIFP